MTKSVFISSTSRDLQVHRAAVKAAIEHLEQRPIDMVNFGSQAGDATQVSLAEVRKAHIFVGIIAHRYGYIPEGAEKSVTEMEYDEAGKRNIPRLMYLVDPDYIWPDEFKENSPKLDSFKSRIEKNHVRSLFTTPDDLARKVTLDIARLLDEQHRKQRFLAVIGAVVGIFALIAVVLLADSGIRSDAIEMAGLASDTPTSTNTHTPTYTPTATATPTNTPTPTATPLEGQPFSENEVGVLLANFKYIDEDATRIEDNLVREFEKAGIDFVRVHHPIVDREQAKQISDIYNTTVVMWGEVARGGIAVTFEITPRRSEVVTSIDELTVSVAQLESFDAYIFEGMDSLYLVNFIEGQLFYFEDKFEEALARFSQAVNDIPSEREKEVRADSLFFYRGTTHYYLREYEQALADFDKSIELDSEYATSYNNRGNVYYDLGEVERAIADYDKATELDPEFVFAYNNRGRAYADLGEYGQAIAEYDKAIELDPEFATGYYNRGIAYYHSENYEQAIAAYDKTIDLAPDYKAAYYNRGLVYLDLGEYEQAIANFDKAIELDPEDDIAYTNRGGVYDILGEYEQAIADFDKAIELYPENTVAYYNRGRVYYILGEYEQAVADFDKAIELDPEYGAYLNRGGTYAALGEYEQAIADFDKAIELDPEFATGYYNRGLVYAALGEYDLALADYDKAIELYPDGVIFYYNRGQVYYLLGEYTRVIADFDKVIELVPAHVNAHYNRGMVYLYDIQNCELAHADFERVLEIAPNDPRADELRSELDNLCPEN